MEEITVRKLSRDNCYYSVAYARINMPGGISVPYRAMLSRDAKLSGREVYFTSLLRGSSEDPLFRADARNPFSLMSLDMSVGDVLEIEVSGDDDIAKDLARNFRTKISSMDGLAYRK